MPNLKHIFLIAAFAVVSSSPAYAHKLNLFASATGNVISGYAYSRGGGRIKGAEIMVMVGDQLVTTLTTNDNGEFSCLTLTRADHKFILKTADGHGATFTVKAAELPASLPAPSSDAATASPPPAAQSDGSSTGDSAKVSDGDLAQIRQQLRLCREEIQEMREERSMQDLIGGAGYLLGLAGIIYYLKAGRRDRM